MPAQYHKRQGPQKAKIVDDGAKRYIDLKVEAIENAAAYKGKPRKEAEKPKPGSFRAPPRNLLAVAKRMEAHFLRHPHDLASDRHAQRIYAKLPEWKKRCAPDADISSFI